MKLKKIDEFEKYYPSTKAIEWYTRDSFLYRLLNQNFCLQDIDIVFKFRFIIKEIYNQLNKLHENFICLSNALALSFADDGSGHPLVESVLFEIEIDTTNMAKPFANI
ncbi:unnamed protein product [Rotaria sp. Silwood1]|nr:unnamed protein product [Rotaria sp. Silwood1]CAF3500350.1 unnamed protein product [Rotaria sp. Silwood1]